MKDEKQDLEQTLNAMKNGTDVKFSKCDENPQEPEEDSEAEKKIKKDEESGTEEKESEEGKGKKKKEDGDEGDGEDEEVIIATASDGSSITACKHSTKSCLGILSSTSEFTPETNKKLLLRTKENIAGVKKAMKKVKFDDDKQGELAMKIHELCRDMNDIINEEARRSKYQDNGMSKALAMAFEPFTEMSYVLLSMVPTKVWNDQFLIRTQDLLAEVADALSQVNNARTYSERVLLLLSLGSQYRTLFQTHPMLKGEVNFINGGGVLAPWNVNTFTDMWEYYLYDDNADNPDGNAIHHRGTVGDNAVQPDITLTKPFFLLFVDDELIYELRKLHISENALSVLGNYAMPTDLWPAEGNNRWEPENESWLNSRISTRNNDGYKDGSTPITIGNRRNDFTWSHNGTLNIISKTPIKLRARNQAFINEVAALIDVARSKQVVEISEDTAFFMILTMWLNAACKYMIDINSSFMNYVDTGSKVDADRFISPYMQNILLKALDSFTPNDGSFRSESILSLLFDKMDLQNDAVTASGFRFSQVAYDNLKKEFNSVTYTMDGDDEYYIGDAKVGNNKIVVTILQKLYLPIDLLAAPVSITTGFVSSNFTRVQHTIVDPYMFGFATANAKFNKRRGVAESGILMNFSLLHMLVRMSNAQYNDIIRSALNYHTFRSIDDREVSLNELFGFDFYAYNGDNNPAIPHLRVLSPLTPAYKRAALLHSAPCSTVVTPFTHNSDDYFNTDRVFLQPLWDGTMQENIGLKSNYAGTNVFYGATLGWAIQALINEHADTSWIMVGLILSQLKSTMRFSIIQNASLQTNPTQITSLYYWINSLANNTGLVDDALCVGGTVPANNYGLEVQYSTLMRRVSLYYNTVLDYKTATLDNPYDKLSYIVPATSVSTADIVKAFRYCTIRTNGRDVVIDNKFRMADKTCPKIIYYTIGIDNNGNSQIAQYSRLIRDGEEVNITEDVIRDQLKTPDFIDEALIIFDNYHIAANLLGGANHLGQYNATLFDTPLTSVPGVIPNTNFVGYNVNHVNDIIETLVTDSKVDLHLNDFCYITNDFYCSSISYTVILPLATYRSDAAIADHEPQNSMNVFNNVRPFEILANAFHRVGFDARDAQSTYSMIAALTGLDPNISFIADERLIRYHDIFVQYDQNNIAADPRGSVGFGLYPNTIDDNLVAHLDVDGKDNFSSTIPTTPDQRESINSSYRYPKLIVVPANTLITGIPMFYDYLSNTVGNECVSSKKSKSFFDKLGSIVPDKGYGFYLRNNDEDSALFALALNGNPNYQGVLNDQLIVSFTIRDVLKTLDIFFKDR